MELTYSDFHFFDCKLLRRFKPKQPSRLFNLPLWKKKIEKFEFINSKLSLFFRVCNLDTSTKKLVFWCVYHDFYSFEWHRFTQKIRKIATFLLYKCQVRIWIFQKFFKNIFFHCYISNISKDGITKRNFAKVLPSSKWLRAFSIHDKLFGLEPP